MPKLSYAQEVADLEEVLAAVRASAGILPPLVLNAAEELAEQIAELKRLKERQRFYAAEGRAATAAMTDVAARGMVEARYIRACAALLYGRNSGRLVQFGIRPRRRPRRKTGESPEAAASPLGHREEAMAAVTDAARTARAGRANEAGNGVEVPAVREDFDGIREERGGVGVKPAGVGGNTAGDRVPVPPVGASLTSLGEPGLGDGENALATRGKAPDGRATLLTSRGATIRAA